MRKLMPIFHHHDHKDMDTLIVVGKKHVKEEGENLKKILEKKNN